MNKRLLLFLPFLLALPQVRAESAADIVRAQVIIGQIQQTLGKLKELRAATNPAAATAGPVAPTPHLDNSGKFYLPYDANGQLTPWANKALGAQIGAAVGAKAGEKAGQMAASKIPFAGGLLAMGAKKKGKELGALAALGGPEFIKQSSSISFDRLEDLSLYLHLNFSASADYVKGFAAAMALYPELAKNYEATIKQAYGAR